MRADDENKAKGSVIAQYFKNLGLKIQILPMEKTKLYKKMEKKGISLYLHGILITIR